MIDLKPEHRNAIETTHCPTCDAEKGEPCERNRTDTGKPHTIEPHVMRVRRAAKILLEGTAFTNPSRNIEDRPGNCACGAPFRSHSVDRRGPICIVTCPTTKETT